MTAGAIGEEFGMAGKRNAGIVNHAFMHRAGDQRGEFAVQAAVAGARQGR